MATKKNPRIQALAKFLHAESGDESESFYAAEMRPTSYDPCLIQTGAGANSPEYLVVTDREADKRAAQDVREHVWAFRPNFIASHSKISYDSTIAVVESLQGKSEDANEAITALIKNMKKFIADAISADGRGHFLSGYDGQEHEVKVGTKHYYIYRVN